MGRTRRGHGGVQPFGLHNLQLGGRHGYEGVRKTGRKGKEKYEGYTPTKKHRTAPHATPLEAAVALAQLLQDKELKLGKYEEPEEGTAQLLQKQLAVPQGLPPRADICSPIY